MNKIIIHREKQGIKITKIICSKRKKPTQLLDRYLSLVNKLYIVIPENMEIL